MTKKRTPSHELEQYSRGRFLSQFSDWVVNSLDEADYAFDFEIRPIGEFVDRFEVHQSPFFVQLKASERFDSPESVWWEFETEYLTGDCLSASIPVVLCIYDRLTDTFNWCMLQQYCWDVLDEENPKWRSQNTVRVRFDRNSLDSVGSRQRLSQAVAQTQRRITMRMSIASQRRAGFATPPGTMSASTEEVRTHKREHVEDARLLATAGHPYRALRRFMQVVQLPEEDRPTLEAICYLLELRETTGPEIALGKLQLASHGAALATEFGDDDIATLCEDILETASEYLETKFIGARYHHIESGRECLVLDLVNYGTDLGFEALWTATIQDSIGDIETETADALAGGRGYELLESGDGTDPAVDACENRAHEFDKEALREHTRSAVCSKCDLRHGVITEWLGQEAPRICGECKSIVYEFDDVRDGIVCNRCR